MLIKLLTSAGQRPTGAERFRRDSLLRPEDGYLQLVINLFITQFVSVLLKFSYKNVFLYFPEYFVSYFAKHFQ